jgi:spermidine synthase
MDKSKQQVLTEWLDGGFGVALKAGPPLESFRSVYQQIDVVDTVSLGRAFLLDGSLMSAAGDEWCYHENAVHLAAITHPAPRHALIIGGGDGGAARQLLKHPSIESVTISELDPAVLDMARRHLGAVHQGALDDPRVTVHASEGKAFLRLDTRAYDLIVLDLTDPLGAAAPLYTEEFFQLCRDHLTAQGALSLHLGSPQFQGVQVAALYRALCSVFATVRPYLVPIALYGGMWAMACAADSLDPATLDSNEVGARLAARRIDGLNYYCGATHVAVQALPPFVQRLLVLS